MGDILSLICCHCRRLILLNDLSISEGRDYHDHCLLQTFRTRISEIDKKIQRGTATILDAKEQGDLIPIEKNIIRDMENPGHDFRMNPDPPIFFGNTPLGLFSVMNPPPWKKLKSLVGTKYHLHQPEIVIQLTEPIFKILTDETGHKYCIQTGSRSVEPQKQLESGAGALPLEQTQKFLNVRGLPVKVDTNAEIK